MNNVSNFKRLNTYWRCSTVSEKAIRQAKGETNVTQKNSLTAKAMVLVMGLSLCNWAFAARPGTEVREDPSALAMASDLVFVRPAMLGVTVVGSALFVLSLPFSAAGGNIKQSSDTLVVKPALNTFVRCLGCTRAGYVNVVD